MTLLSQMTAPQRAEFQSAVRASGIKPPAGVPTAAPATTLDALAQSAGMRYGAAFDPSVYNGDAPYAALLRQQAGVYTAENVMKESVVWTGPTEYTFTQADAFAAIAQSDGKIMRGHVLFYPIKARSWQTGGGLTSGNWQNLCESYLQAVLTRPSLQAVTDWDVLNEIIGGDTNSDGSGYITGTPHITAAGSGDAFLQFAYTTAAKYTSQRLFYCESNVEFSNSPYFNVKRANVLAALARAKNAGCRIDGYSMQCHLRPDPYSYDYRVDRQVLRNFCKSLISLGLVVNITEIDVQYPAAGWTGSNNEWDRRAAEYVYQVVDTILETTAGTASFPAHVSSWGLSDKYTSWPNNPNPQRSHPYDSSLAPKAMFSALQQVLGGYSL